MPQWGGARKDNATPVWVAAILPQIEALIVLRISGANLDTPNNDGCAMAFVAAAGKWANFKTSNEEIATQMH